MNMQQRFIDMVVRGAWVRVYSGAPGCENDVMAEGEVVAYCEAPTVMLIAADGEQSSWSTRLRIEEVDRHAE